MQFYYSIVLLYHIVLCKQTPNPKHKGAAETGLAESDNRLKPKTSWKSQETDVHLAENLHIILFMLVVLISSRTPHTGQISEQEADWSNWWLGVFFV